MCDTLIKRTPVGFIFGKNSDRSANEPNLTVYIPAQVQKDAKLKCTYIDIEQVPNTNAIVLVKPSWIWGAEMGINDHNVMIGNEAVFTKTKGQKTERLIGMDLLRLGLERGSSALEALNVIVGLLAKYGQGGNCGFDKPFYYDNSFLIADKDNAYILETAGQEWVAHEISGHGNISNRLSLNNAFFLSSSGNNAGFAKKKSEPLFTFFSGSGVRAKTACSFLEAKDPFSVASMMAALRSHHTQDSKRLYQQGSVKSLCMHQSLFGDHTTGSMIVESRPLLDTIWLTGCSTPCLSIYKPAYFGIMSAPISDDQEKSLAYWLEREYLVRAIYAGLIDEKSYRKERDAIQSSFIDGDKMLVSSHPSPEQLRIFANNCARREQAFVDKYQKEIEIVKNQKGILPKIWEQRTPRLGKNVFNAKLSDRSVK